MPDIPIFQPERDLFRDLDRELFTFFSPIEEFIDPEPPPNLARVGTRPGIVNAGPMPQQRPPRYGLLAQRTWAPWIEPAYWSDPWDVDGDICLPFFGMRRTVISIEVPDTRLGILTGVSYDLDQTTAFDGMQFEVRVCRNGQVLAAWTDRVMNNAAANPNERYAIGAHDDPVPVRLSFDPNTQLTIEFILDGPANQVFNGLVYVLTRGYLSRLRDTRQGAPKMTEADPRDRMDGNLDHMVALTADILQRTQGGG